MPHPVRGTQTTTTPPHQPSPPTPPPLGTPPDRPTSPPGRLPTLLAAPAWPGRRAGGPVAQPTFAGWRAGPPPPARRSPCSLPPPKAGLRAAGPGSALGCPSGPRRRPLPSCAQLTGARGLQAGRAGGACLRTTLEQVVWAAIYPCPALAGAFGPPQPTALFCASSRRSVAVLHRSSAVCRAYRCSGSTRHGRIRVGVRGWGGEALARSIAAQGGAAVSPSRSMAWHGTWHGPR